MFNKKSHNESSRISFQISSVFATNFHIPFFKTRSQPTDYSNTSTFYSTIMTTSIKFKENREHHTLIGNELYPRFWSATPIFSAISTDLEKTTFPQKFDNDTKSSIHALTAICILKTIANSAAQNIEFFENRDLILSCASSLGKEHSILIASIVDSLWRNGLFVLTNQLAVCSLYLFSDESTAADLLQCADTRVVTKEEAIACLIPSSIEYLRDHINAMRFQYAGENSPY